MVYNGYYKVMSNIPKMGQLPTPDLWDVFLNRNKTNVISPKHFCYITKYDLQYNHLKILFYLLGNGFTHISIYFNQSNHRSYNVLPR